MLTTVHDLLTRWPSCTAETPQLEALIGDAEAWLHAQYPHIPDDPQQPLRGVIVSVTCPMVKRALLSSDYAGLASYSEGFDGFSYQSQFRNSEGNLYLTAQERAVLEKALDGAGLVRGGAVSLPLAGFGG